MLNEVVKAEQSSIVPTKLKEYFNQGVNISELLRSDMRLNHNSSHIIEIVYDLQSGDYNKDFSLPENKNYYENYTLELANIIKKLMPNVKTICEAGVGEATTLSCLLKNFNNSILSYGFDISWSRIACAKNWLQANKQMNVNLCTGSLFDIPYLDNSVDIVYTSHSIEPNGGFEAEILQELYRVARYYLILLEPSYEFANDYAKQRMDQYGYCKNLKKVSEKLGFSVVRHELFSTSANQFNPTAITIIKKNDQSVEKFSDEYNSIFACPKYKTELEFINGVYFSESALSVYPVLNGIPCLRTDNAILASKFKDFLV